MSVIKREWWCKVNECQRCQGGYEQNMETHNLTEQEIAALYPKFRQWTREVKRYMSVGGVHTILLWYEWLRTKGAA